MIKTLRILRHQVGLWFRRGDFHGFLGPGTYALPGRLAGIDRVEVIDTLKTELSHRLLDVIVQDVAARDWLRVVDLTDDQRAVVVRDGRVAYVLGPGRHAFWSKPYALDVEVFDAREARLVHASLDAILALPNAARLIWAVDVDATEKVQVFRNGEPLAMCGPGRHAFWIHGAKLTFQNVDLRERVADVVGQEIMTADKVTLRVNLVVTFRVADPVLALTAVSDYAQALYREAQLALRAAVGPRTLEDLLGRKDAVTNEIRDALRGRAKDFGIEVVAAGLRDVILPGDMKTILNQVIEAQKQAEANLIRRREETAAARSQANTARLLRENPVLQQMKELEALQEILKGTKATFIIGAGNLSEELRSLVRSDSSDP